MNFKHTLKPGHRGQQKQTPGQKHLKFIFTL